MHTSRLLTLLLSSLALSLTACGGGDDGDISTPPVAPAPPVVAPEAGDAIVLTASGKLLSFNVGTPGIERTNVAISGLQAGETLVGIDYRPADGQLYGVGSSARIYTLNPNTGAATFKSTIAADAADLTAPYTALAGATFGVDFNPMADRLRLVSNTGQNLRINVDTGAATTDGAINGGPASTALTAAAYTNSFAGTGSTTLFVIDAAGSTIYTQNPPNNGTLTSPVSLGVTASSVGGFDIDARNNKAYAVLTVAGVPGLYAINLAATGGAASFVVPLGSEDMRGIALRAPTVSAVYGLSDTGRIVSFMPTAPTVLATDVAITGLNAGERMLGVDFRPLDGLMYGMSSAARLFTINPATGAATLKASMAADAADLSAPFTAVSGTEFAVDFNPLADRLRVISSTGQSLRINVDTGATTTDGSINRAGALPTVSAAAYTNSFAGTVATSLLDVDTSSDNLALQNPPNDGTLTNIGLLGLDVMGDAGMDIGGGDNGMAIASLRTLAGPSMLYRVNLSTGAATLINGAANPALSVIGSGTLNVIDVAVSIR